ncbi:hypothetical protein DN062_13290 [Nitrincola tibetensis]|uniref:histidine kinase n=1 Tax=Nitrincola tibetensis TaxID=2219697 RepID=A0A364NK32_9GAMM|nr:ATP-binding protein [Nitrincola tibetensis]RAU17391.1 hypothetical protein DN062_13290 [Nitrincola tibetensis]
MKIPILHEIPGRILAPVLLAVVAILAVFYNHEQKMNGLERLVIASEQDNLRDYLRLQKQPLNDLYKAGRLDEQRLQFSILSTRALTTHSFVLDQDLNLIMSLSDLESGTPLGPTLIGDDTLLFEIANSLLLKLSSDIEVKRVPETLKLIGYISLDYGHLIVVRDLSPQMAYYRTRVLRMTFKDGITFLLAAMLLAVGMYVMWFRRSQAVLDTLTQIGNGNLSARCSISGRNEMSEIAQAINGMADHLSLALDREKHLVGLINRSPIVVFEWKNLPGWPVNFVSESVKSWGYSVADFMHGEIQFFDLIHPDDQARILEEVTHYLVNGPDDYRQEYRIVCANQDELWVDDRTWLVRDQLGDVAIIYGVVVDVTELKRSELRIRELNDVLEQRVEERTNALEAANQELEAFTYSVSHDLKAPLRGIDGYSQLLMEAYRNQLDEEGITFLRNIRDGVGQMHQLIEDLLSYSRIERKALQTQSFDVSLFVKELVEYSLKADPHPKAKITIGIPPCQLELDPDGFALVMRNVLTNALKFSINQQLPRVEIRGRVTDTRFVLEIEDNGVGFDMKYHDRIFQIFQRLHRREDFPGTGVGLALVKKAMQRMGGEVRAESEPGKGALFILEFDL